MDFSEKQIRKNLFQLIYLDLLEDVENSHYKYDEFYHELVASIAGEAVLSIKRELAGQKKPYYLLGQRSAAYNTYICRRNNEIKSLIKLRVSAEHERLMALGNFHPEQPPADGSDNYDAISQYPASFEPPFKGGISGTPEDAMQVMESIPAAINVLKEVKLAIDKLRTMEPHGNKYAQIAEQYISGKMLEKLIHNSMKVTARNELSLLCRMLGFKENNKSNRKFVSHLKFRTKKYWKAIVTTDDGRTYIDDCFEIRTEHKKPKFGAQLMATYNNDDEEDEPLPVSTNTVSEMEKKKLLEAQQASQKMAREKNYLGCYRPGKCPPESDMCPCSSVNRTLTKYCTKVLSKQDILGKPHLLRAGLKPWIKDALTCRPKRYDPEDDD